MDFSKLKQSQEEKVREARDTLSDNKVEDLVRFTRGNVICNEEQAMFLVLTWLTGWMDDRHNYANTVTIGSSGGGKSHLDDNMRKILPNTANYEATAGSDKSFLDDDDWEGTLVATLDELNKINEDILEYIKTVSADEEYRYKRTVRDQDSRTDFDTVTITKEAKPVTFLYAQHGMDNEMSNRLFKNYVDESESIHRAIGRKEAGHQEIQIEDTDDDIEYIYETDELEDALRTHIASIPTESYIELPEWVWYACEPIFNHSRTEVNRIYGMVFNFIRASALLNYDNRRGDGSEDDPFVAEEQDVVNVLSARKTLTGTTHELEPRKWAIIEAIREQSGYEGGGGCTREDIHDYLDSSGNDAIDIKKNKLKPLIEELEDNYVVKAHRDRKPYEYEFNTLAKLGTPECVFDEWDVDLRDVTDPVHNQPFGETIKEFEDFKQSKGRLDTSDSSQTASEDSQGQSTFDEGNTLDVDLDPTERAVHAAMKESIDGTVVKFTDDGEDEKEPFSKEHAIGLVEPNEEIPLDLDTEGSLLDPEHDVWDRHDKDDEWVTNQTDCETHVEDAIKSLNRKGVWEAQQAGSTESFRKIVVSEVK